MLSLVALLPFLSLAHLSSATHLSELPRNTVENILSTPSLSLPDLMHFQQTSKENMNYFDFKAIKNAYERFGIHHARPRSAFNALYRAADSNEFVDTWEYFKNPLVRRYHVIPGYQMFVIAYKAIRLENIDVLKKIFPRKTPMIQPFYEYASAFKFKKAVEYFESLGPIHASQDTLKTIHDRQVLYMAHHQPEVSCQQFALAINQVLRLPGLDLNNFNHQFGGAVRPDRTTLSTLMFATRCGDKQLVQKLLNEGAELDHRIVKDGREWDVADIAVEADQFEILDLLVRHGAKVNEETMQVLLKWRIDSSIEGI